MTLSDNDLVKVIFVCFLCLFAGGMGGSYYQSFSIPTMKIWTAERTYDHILIADDVVCNPMNEKNISYYEYETIVYNKTEYIFSKRTVDNITKNIIVCGDV